MIKETKLDENFPRESLKIPGHKMPYQKDCNIHGGQIMFFAREDTPLEELTSVKSRENIKGLFVEINVSNSQWLLFTTYKSPSLWKEKFLKLLAMPLELRQNLR